MPRNFKSLCYNPSYLCFSIIFSAITKAIIFLKPYFFNPEVINLESYPADKGIAICLFLQDSLISILYFR